MATNFAPKNVCHEANAPQKSCTLQRTVCCNFTRDGGRSTAFGVQALIANHFMLLLMETDR